MMRITIVAEQLSRSTITVSKLYIYQGTSLVPNLFRKENRFFVGFRGKCPILQ